MGLKYNPNTKAAIAMKAASVEVDSNTNLQEDLDNKDALVQSTYIDMLSEASNILEMCSTIQTNLRIAQWL